MLQDKQQKKDFKVQLRLEVTVDQHQILHKSQNKDNHQEIHSDVHYQQSLGGEELHNLLHQEEEGQEIEQQTTSPCHEETVAIEQTQAVMDQK